MLKYKLTDVTKEWDGHTLHKIEYTKEWLESMEVEELEGGWIESEENLTQEGGACVFGNARVFGDAWVYGDAQVFGNARVFGDARVYGDAWVFGDARVYGDARVFGDAWVYGNACVYGNARVYGNAWVSQGTTTTMRITATEQWFEYQHVIAELQKKWDKEEKK